MKRQTQISLIVSFFLGLVACSDDGATQPADNDDTKITTTAPEVTFKPGASGKHTVKPRGPVQISYRIIGQPIIGQPLAIELQFTSALGVQPFNVSYRVNDATALQLPESQSSTVSISPSAGKEQSFAAQQVTVIPLREGRLYLNVSAHVETENGSLSSVTAIPIQVGAATRAVSENGVVMTDENGELIRSMPAKEY